MEKVIMALEWWVLGLALGLFLWNMAGNRYRKLQWKKEKKEFFRQLSELKPGSTISFSAHMTEEEVREARKVWRGEWEDKRGVH